MRLGDKLIAEAYSPTEIVDQAVRTLGRRGSGAGPALREL